jgi:hypothetical protein
MTTRIELLKMVSALAELGNRTLPTITSDLRVAKLLRLLKPDADEIDKRRAKIVEAATEAASKTEDQGERNAINAKLVADLNAFFSESSDVELPPENKRLTESDLPKDLAGDNGADNRKALATLLADLGELYIFND